VNKNKTRLIISIILSLVFVFGFLAFKGLKAASSGNVSGWAWSENIGWISFNSKNCDVDDDGVYEGANEGGGATPAPTGCPDSGTAYAYGMKINPAGDISDYAWSENIGLIAFKRVDTGTPPSPPYNGGEAFIAKTDNLNISICDANGNGFLDANCGGKDNSTTPIANYKQVFGWARVISACKDNLWDGAKCTGSGAGNLSGGWDGWIKFSRDFSTPSSNYGVTIDINSSQFRGWAWGGDVVGWISFNCSNQDVLSCLRYKVKLLGINPAATNLRVDNHNPADYCFVTSYAPVRMRWDFVGGPGAKQAAYRVEIYEGANLKDRSCDSGLSNPNARCLSDSQSYISNKLAYDKTYSWKLTVWDDKDNKSEITSGPNFTTIPHPYPLPAFKWTPTRPSAKELMQLQDQTNFYDSKPTSRSWDWDFNDGTPHSSLQNPTHTYTDPNLSGYQVTLKVVDGDSYGPCSLTRSISVIFPAPGWQEAPPPSK
jgi:hypothetical protein